MMTTPTMSELMGALEHAEQSFEAARRELYERTERALVAVIRELAEDARADEQLGSEVVGTTLSLLHGTGTPILFVPDSLKLAAHNGTELTVTVPQRHRTTLAAISAALFNCWQDRPAVFDGETIGVNLRAEWIMRSL